MERETSRDVIFNIIKKYHQTNGNLETFGIHEYLISNGIDLSEEVLEERIKHFKYETSKADNEENKSS